MNIHLYLHREMRTRDKSKESLIREKAITMIVNMGFDGLSMQKLAVAAGVSPATLYIYYNNREHMLQQLYSFVEVEFAKAALKGFNPGMNLKQGLWLQWKNRMGFITRHPEYFLFFEQFRHSPLILRSTDTMKDFRSNMHLFVTNAVKRKQLSKMEPEVFWSLAYGPFYSIMKFHLRQESFMNHRFNITDKTLKQLLNKVILSLKPLN